MGAGLDILAIKRVNQILLELVDIRTIPQRLRFLERIPVIDTTEGEILGRYTGRVYISDIITTGSTAVVKAAGKYTTEQFAIPKIKHGVLIDEEMIALLIRLEAGVGLNFDELTLRGYIVNRLDDILLGIRQRMNQLAVSMLLDSFDYIQGGVVIQGANWGTPAAFKSTPAIPWVVAATGLPNPSATPITDISVQIQHDMEVYGETRNRVTLSSIALRGILGTDEYKAKAQLYSQIVFPANSFPLNQELMGQVALLERMLDFGTAGPMSIEVEDSRFWDLAGNGVESNAPFLPPNKVLLTNTADDNDASAAYIGNVVVPETAVSALVDVGSVVGRFDGPARGPVAWTEAPSLNPPDVNVWGAAKLWPVRRRRGLADVLTVY